MEIGPAEVLLPAGTISSMLEGTIVVQVSFCTLPTKLPQYSLSNLRISVVKLCTCCSVLSITRTVESAVVLISVCDVRRHSTTMMPPDGAGGYHCLSDQLSVPLHAPKPFIVMACCVVQDVYKSRFACAVLCFASRMQLD